MRIDVISIFPGMFDQALSSSMTGIAQKDGALDIHYHDLRDWTHDSHRTTDDTPYGGGPGMVMKPEPIFEAVEAVHSMSAQKPHTVFLTPVGSAYNQSKAVELSSRDWLVLVCGRYEGFDERTYTLADELLSIGDYVLTGGELPAMVVIDSVARLLPGVLGDEESAADESFSDGLLEYPQYTRPAEFGGQRVPEVLVSGNHGKIASWRREQSIRRTARVRPDLIDRAHLTDSEMKIASDETDGDVDK